MDYSITAKRLKELRQSKKLSHEQLSEKLKLNFDIDINSRTLMNYESAAKDILHSKASSVSGMSIEKLDAIARFYDVSTDYLLGFTTIETADPDLKFICDYTGLNENTVLMLKESVYNENVFSSLDTVSDYIYNLHKMVNLMFSNEDFIMLFCSNFINYLDEEANRKRFYYIYSQGNIPLGLDFTNLYLMGMQQSLKKFKDDYIEKENLKKQNLEGTHNANNN